MLAHHLHEREPHRHERELIEARDALEQKTIELARSVALLRATLESTTNGILALDASGNVIDFNQNFLSLWRVPPAISAARDRNQILGVMFQQFPDSERARARFSEIITWPAASSDLIELADGRVIERHSRPQLVEGENAGSVWSFRDVTETRRAQQRLRDEARVLELLNSTGETLASTLDLEALVQAVTDAATELSGAKFGAFFYNNFDERGESYLLYSLSGAPREAFEKFGQPRATPLFAPTFRGGPPIRCADVTRDARYGKMGPGMPRGHLPVRSYLAVSVVSRSSEVIGGLFFGHPEPDVFTERSERLIVGIAAQAAVALDNARLYDAAQRAARERQQLLERERGARAAAERMSALKDEFLATLSHELRTPLNAILGWAQMLRLGVRSADDLGKGLETIERNARVQTQLIEDLLDMSRILAGKVRLDVQPLDPAVAIRAALDTVGPAAVAKGIELQARLDPAAGPLVADASRLQQVMWNLLSNAIKFTPRGGQVRVELQRVSSQVEINVADTGAGISHDFIAHVFDRFRQADASTTRRHGGLGLGLSIVKHLVELHGGSVRAASPGEGCGSIFTVQLPLAALAPQSAGGSQRPGAAVGAAPEFSRIDLSGVHVLVVEDDSDSRELIERVLKDCAAEVTVATGAVAALSAFGERRPDVLVTDIGMPEMDGIELLRRVRKLEQAQPNEVPAVALTALARAEDRSRVLSAGFLVHVAKPVEPSELIATIARVVGRTA